MKFNKLSGESRKIIPVVIDDSVRSNQLPEFIKSTSLIYRNIDTIDELIPKLTESLGRPASNYDATHDIIKELETSGKKVWSVEITLDADYDEITIEEQEALLREIEDFLGRSVKVSLKKREV